MNFTTKPTGFVGRNNGNLIHSPVKKTPIDQYTSQHYNHNLIYIRNCASSTISPMNMTPIVHGNDNDFDEVEENLTSVLETALDGGESKNIDFNDDASGSTSLNYNDDDDSDCSARFNYNNDCDGFPKKRNKRAIPTWTAEEDRILLNRHQAVGNNWVEISKLLPGRSRMEVKTRHRSIMRAYKRMWKPNEDKIILEFHSKYRGDWVDKASKAINRTRNAIRMRYKELSGNKYAVPSNKEPSEGSPEQIFYKAQPQFTSTAPRKVNNEPTIFKPASNEYMQPTLFHPTNAPTGLAPTFNHIPNDQIYWKNNQLNNYHSTYTYSKKSNDAYEDINVPMRNGIDPVQLLFSTQTICLDENEINELLQSL